jgi:RNA polymerase sigma-70 factor (ECF subfamily)
VKDRLEGGVILAEHAAVRAGIEDALSSDLVARAQHGDHGAFETLVRPHVDRLTAIAARILRDPYAAEDAVQEAIVAAWRDLQALRDPERFDAWLYRTLVNACRAELRRRRRRPISVPVLDTDLPGDDDATTLVARRDEVTRAFERLSVDHRAVLVLTHYLGYTAPEIARVLGIPVGTVASRLHYGAAAMRRALRPGIRTTPDFEAAP